MGQISVTCHASIQGRYKLKVYSSDGSLRLETPWFDNLITNNGMNLLASTVDLTPNCYIGNSNTKPNISNTQLGNILHTSDSVAAPIYTFFDGDEAYWRAYKVYTFNAGNATGTIREVGVGLAPTNLFSRSLIYGVAEVPAAITVLDDEKLEVYYERRNYINKTDTFAAFNIANGPTIVTPYSATIRAANIGTVPDIFSGFGPTRLNGVTLSISGQKFLGTVYEPISGSSVVSTVVSAAAYVADSHYIDYIFQFGPTGGNYSGGVGTGTFQSTQSRFKFLFNPYIPKTAEYRLRLNVRHSWSRYVPAL